VSTDVDVDGAGLGVRDSHDPRADVTVDGDTSLAQLATRIVDGLVGADVLVDVADALPADRREARDVLLDAGVGALDGRLADVVATLAAATDRDADAVPAQSHREVVDVLRALGSGHVDGQPSGLDDLFRALPPLLASTQTPGSTPRISVRLGVSWPSCRREARSQVLRFLADLAVAVDVDVVLTDAAAETIVDAHRADVPTTLLTQSRNRRAPPHGDAGADAGDGSISSDGRPAAVLAALSTSSTDSLSYRSLARRMALDSPPYEAVRRLADRALVERMDRADGATVVSLRPAGADLADALDRSHGLLSGRSSPALSRSTDTPGSDSPDHTPPKSLPPCRVVPEDGTPPPDPPADRDSAGDERPAEAAEAAADGDRTDRYGEGLVWPRYGDRADWVPALEAHSQGEMTLVDADLSARLDDDRDGRQPHVSYVDGDDAVVVGAEYHNPMQFATALASGLTSERLLATADWGDRIGDGLRGLDISAKPVLWSAVCMGWLPSDVDDGDDYLDELRDARDDLREMSGEVRHDDGADRGDVARTALGLVGTIVQLLDLLGVDVVIEMRIPECSRHYSPANPDRREDLVDHIGMLSALTSRVGAFSAFRQLFEDRPEKRSDAFTPGFDRGESPRRGSNRAGIVVCGDGVESLADDVVDAVDAPRPLHDDAPPIGVDVDVSVGARDGRIKSTARRMLRSRGLRPTLVATAALAGFVASPWSAADAVHWGLSLEADRRDVHLDEVRRALASLDVDRLLPDAAPAARAGVGALLDADGPISQAELARRADISTQSWRNHRDALAAAGVVRETADGWRLCLPFRSERYDDDVDGAPWWLGDGADRRDPTDVLGWLADRGWIDWSRTLDDGPIGRAFDVVGPPGEGLPRGAVDVDVASDAIDAVGLPPGLVLAGCGGASTSPAPATASMGTSTRQSTLS